jgi:hypothetical protein
MIRIKRFSPTAGSLRNSLLWTLGFGIDEWYCNIIGVAWYHGPFDGIWPRTSCTNKSSNSKYILNHHASGPKQNDKRKNMEMKFGSMVSNERWN